MARRYHHAPLSYNEQQDDDYGSCCCCLYKEQNISIVMRKCHQVHAAAITRYDVIDLREIMTSSRLHHQQQGRADDVSELLLKYIWLLEMTFVSQLCRLYFKSAVNN